MDDKILLEKGDYDIEYEPTDSEDEYSEEEKELLKNVRRGNRPEQDSKKQILAFDDSDDDDLMNDSDIEGAEDNTDLPDDKDWGSKARNYYNTDFVDQDYSTYNEQEEELAKQEEEEAKIIQMRLAKQMNEGDFLLEENFTTSEIETEKSDNKKSTKIKADFSGLSKSEQLKLFHKDSPEFEGLMADFTDYMNEVKDLLDPVSQYILQNNVPMIPALEFAVFYKNMMLTYCYNICFYLSLKAKRAAVRNHPVIKRLVNVKNLLNELKDKYDNIIKPQLEALLERINDGDIFQVLDSTARTDVEKNKKKTKLSILDQYENNKELQSADDEDDMAEADITDDENVIEEEQNEDDMEDGDTRRGITYQIAKNKGLTPNRKKELRNPRVKHRSKFRKALIRRKGAVRTVRKETKRYGGELSGIKTSVVKSVKFKS